MFEITAFFKTIVSNPALNTKIVGTLVIEITQPIILQKLKMEKLFVKKI